MLYGYTLDFLLDEMPLEHVMMLFEYGMEWHGADLEKYKTEPDKEKFYERYKDKIKRPEGVK